MTSSPDLLHGLLDDNIAALLDDLVTRDGQLPAVELPESCEALSFGDLMPMYNAPLPGQALAHGQSYNPEVQCEDNSHDNQSSRKRSGSGYSHLEETLTSEVPLQDPTLKRQKAHQEKNKRAQKRYRERKKALYEDQQKRIEELTAQQQEVQMSKDQLQSRCSLLEKVVSIRNDSTDAAASSGPQPPALQLQSVPEYVTATAALLGAIYPGHGMENTLRTEHVERMTIQDYIKVMTDFEQRLVRLMAATDGREGCPVRGEIEKMIEARRWSTSKVLAHNPARMMRIALEVRSRKMCGGTEGSKPDMQRLLAAMELTADQKARIVENRRRLLLGLEQLLRRQSAAVEVLQQSMPLQYNDMSASMAFLKATIAAQDVTEGLTKHHGVVRDFMSELLGPVLTLWQEAKCWAEALPAFPDALAISNALAEELGDESANARLLLLKPGPGAGYEVEMPRQPLMLQLMSSALAPDTR